MEPVSAPTKNEHGLEEHVGKEQRGKGRLGSLENPETYETSPAT